MTKFDVAAEALKKGDDHTMKVFGHSMRPSIESGFEVTLRSTDDYVVGDVVVCKVSGRWLVHKITKVGADGRFLIANNRGRENGWTKHVIGRVVAVNDVPFGRKV